MLLIYVFWEILKNQNPLSPVELLKILRSFFEIKFVPFQLLNVLFSYLWISPSVYWQLLFVLDHRIMINSLQSGFGPTFVQTALLKVTGDHILANCRVSPRSVRSLLDMLMPHDLGFSVAPTLYFGFLLWALLPTHFPVIPVFSLWGKFCLVLC